MSGMVHDVNSVVSFTPATDPGWYVECSDDTRHPVVGWAVVVIERNQWVVTTDTTAVVADPDLGMVVMSPGTQWKLVRVP